MLRVNEKAAKKPDIEIRLNRPNFAPSEANAAFSELTPYNTRPDRCVVKIYC